MSTTKPDSPFYKRYFVGKNTKGADEHGYKWSWDTSHPDLTPTSTFVVGYAHYCSYCGEAAKSIQAGLARAHARHRAPRSDEYDTTGYTCHCKDSMQERAYEKAREEMKERHRQELEDLEEKMMPVNIEERQRPFEYQRKMEHLHREYSDVRKKEENSKAPRVACVSG